MKISVLIFFGIISTSALNAQTLNLISEGVTYQIPAAQAGDMVFSDGTSLNILGKTFTLNNIDKIYIDDSNVTDSTVTITYNGSSADVKIAARGMQFLTPKVSGANVSILQSPNLQGEITYNLTGSSEVGSFYTDGSYKTTVDINNLTLANPDSAAIKIENGKRININIKGTNTLKDSSSSQDKGTLMVNGHSEISGSGTLNIYGYAKNAFWADEYVMMKSSMTGTINILYAAGDGINANQYFVQNGGTLNVSGTLDDGIKVRADNSETGYARLSGGTITVATTAAASKGINAEGDIIINAAKSTPTVTVSNSGKGKWDSTNAEVKGSSCLSSDANITIDEGNVTLTATGAGGKGIKCDSIFVMNGGNVTVKTTGKAYVNINGQTEYNGNYTGTLDRLSDAYNSSSKGIKVGIKSSSNGGTPLGNIEINGGNLSVTCSGAQEGSEGIESKNTLYVNGGTVTCQSYDDAINSAKNLYIKGGIVTTVSSNNDGLDSNADLYIQGGTIAAFGASAPECSVDAAEGYNVYFQGGTLLGVGGSQVTPASSSSQSYVSTSATATAGTTISLNSGSKTLASFTVPSIYSSSSSQSGGGMLGPGPGGMSGSSNIMITCLGLTKGCTYNLTNGSATSTVTAK